ncbi:MAG: SprT-like domain-containing protein [Akkermansiaceae bacterium]
MEREEIYHGIVTIVDGAISLLSVHAGEEYANSVSIVWNRRMRSTAGRAFLNLGKVELNPKLLHLGDDPLGHVRQTLLHELAHLLAHHRYGRKISAHGAEWKQACADLGIPGESATHSLPLPSRTQRRKWRYTCPVCLEVIDRVRRMRGDSACYACCKMHNRGKFHRQYKFIEEAL